ncbi:MAG: hypothetical protein HYW07_00235 [Candidatus Latescibacteria bacterium]|nr:hypothetical protein [Candidatus Latescibacterota bacterium]
MSAHLKPLKRRLLQLSLALLGSAASSGIIACADGNSPTSSAPPGQVYLVFSPQSNQRLAKSLSAGSTVSKIIGPRGGKLVAMGEAAEIEAALSIPKNALAEEVAITMSVHEGLLSELVIAFAPEGLVFLQAARLELKVDTELVDIPLSELKAYHQSADGTSQEAQLLSVSSSGDGLVRIAIAVPGFSTYGLRGSS